MDVFKMDKNAGLKTLNKFIKQNILFKEDKKALTKAADLRKDYDSERYAVFESRDEYLRHYEWIVFANTKEEYKAILQYNPAYLQLVLDIKDEKIIEVKSRSHKARWDPEKKQFIAI